MNEILMGDMEKNINNYFQNYMKNFGRLIKNFDATAFSEAIEAIERCKSLAGKLIFVGNGGSAAMASHVSVDFTKACKIRSINFNEADLLTCFSNDYGYENWVVEALKAYIDKDDLVVLISSSGNSENMINAADYCIEYGQEFITLSGFDAENALRKKSKTNFWVNSSEYNFVEMAHHVWLVGLVDYFAAKPVFE